MTSGDRSAAQGLVLELKAVEIRERAFRTALETVVETLGDVNLRSRPDMAKTIGEMYRFCANVLATGEHDSA